MANQTKKFEYDFKGWATRPNVKCSDGVTIEHGAFSGCNGAVVPIVWNHQHHSPENILGHALLVEKDGGVYTYGSLNGTPMGQNVKTLLQHGDINRLSIFANDVKRLKRPDGDIVQHGKILEVSLVIAGANPQAFIDEVVAHSEDAEPGIIMCLADEPIIAHGEIDVDVAEDPEPATTTEEVIAHADDPTPTKEEPEDGAETFGDILNTMTEKQRNAVYGLIEQALDKNSEDDNEGGNDNMKHNVFDKETEKNTDEILSQSEIKEAITDAKRYGSMKESFIAHAEAKSYGIEDLEFLFPEAKAMTTTPEFIKRDTGWVSKVMNAVHRSPFARIKSVFADITEDDARAKGYMKGNLKKEEVFSLLKRVTTPTTIYKKQKMDRDDVVDITDLDVIAWIKMEMRMMLDEELARAILIGDGRLNSSDDKINEQNIRPIIKDEELYTIQTKVEVRSADDDATRAKAMIRAAIKSRKNYKGSGSPTFWTTEDMLTECLLLEDTLGHALYADEAALARKLRVKEIVTVPVMEGVTAVGGGKLMGIIANLADYNVGADKGGVINMFEDFDIDYNQQKYLIETRCSGALTKPYSAIVLEEHVSG